MSDHIMKKGVMYMLSDKPFWWVIPSICVCVAAFAAAVAVKNLTGVRLLGYLAILIVCIPAEVMFILARTGTRCEYEADDEKLTIRRPNKPAECYYYSETRAVEITLFRMLWIKCGYKVTIETKYRTIIRYYAFDGPNDMIPPTEIPFAILGKNIPQKVENKEIISGSEYYGNV